ncbi:hypothetical protein Tco_0292247 [Tanacetum coccineum]
MPWRGCWIVNLEKDVNDLKTFYHSEVPNAVKEYLGTSLDDALYKAGVGTLCRASSAVIRVGGHIVFREQRVDSCVFPISVPLYTGGVSEKDPAPHLTARQEQTVKLLGSHKASFRRYPECFLCLVGLSPYYPFDENSYPAFEYPDRTEMGLFDFIMTTDPRKVQAVEAPAAGGSSSAVVAEVPVLTEERHENVVAEDAYLELADPDEQAQEEEVVREQPEKVNRKRLVKRSDALPAKRLRKDYPKPASSTGGKTLVELEQIMPAGSRLLDWDQPASPPVASSSQEHEGFLDSSAQTNFQIPITVESSSTLSVLVDVTATATP